MNGLLVNNLKSAHQIFMEEGILFYPKIFEGEELTRLRNACEYVLEQFLADLDKSGERRNDVVMRHLNDTRWHPQSREHWRVIAETVADPRCLGPVEQIFRETSLFRTTSLFFNPRFESYEGNWHRDTQFIVENEDRVREEIAKHETGGIQFQIALVDNDDIEYVPYTPNRYDSPEEYYYRCADDRKHSAEAGMPNALRIPQRAGDAVIFNPKGLHRGRYHVDNPRRTFMLTYTPRSQPYYDYFSNQPWALDMEFHAELSPRARAYFDDFIHVYKEFWLSK